MTTTGTTTRPPVLATDSVLLETDLVRSPAVRKALAVLRIALGWTFLWAFLDKTFALGFSTGHDQEGNLDRFGEAAWINGASPTEGFLQFGVNPESPFAGFFNSLSGSVVIDWLFMLGLLGIGLALILGIGIRLGAISGALMYLMMYAAVMLPENNPITDDHLIGAISVVLLGLALSCDTWGFGKTWAHTSLVRRFPILR